MDKPFYKVDTRNMLDGNAAFSLGVHDEKAGQVFGEEARLRCG